MWYSTAIRKTEYCQQIKWFYFPFLKYETAAAEMSLEGISILAFLTCSFQLRIVHTI